MTTKPSRASAEPRSARRPKPRALVSADMELVARYRHTWELAGIEPAERASATTGDRADVRTDEWPNWSRAVQAWRRLRALPVWARCALEWVYLANGPDAHDRFWPAIMRRLADALATPADRACWRKHGNARARLDQQRAGERWLEAAESDYAALAWWPELAEPK